MIHQNGRLALGQRLCDLCALLNPERDAAVVRIDGLGTEEVAEVLVEHFQRASEGGPGAAVNGMGMADSVDVGAGFVDGRVDAESRSIDGP